MRSIKAAIQYNYALDETIAESVLAISVLYLLNFVINLHGFSKFCSRTQSLSQPCPYGLYFEMLF